MRVLFFIFLLSGVGTPIVGNKKPAHSARRSSRVFSQNETFEYSMVWQVEGSYLAFLGDHDDDHK
jgi:hypothetical protein